MKRKARILDLVAYLVLGAGLLLTAAPFLWALITSLSREADVLQWPPRLIPHPVMWQNYVTAWHRAPFGRFFLNSFIQAGLVVAGQLVTASTAGYAFARLRFPGRDALLLGILGLVMIPFEVTMIPLFILVYKLGWLNTYQALVVPALATPFGTFLMRQFFLTIPPSLEEAARMDGCSRLGTFVRIVLPLSKSALATLAVFTFTAIWNSLLWPLLVTDQVAMRTVQVGLTYLTKEIPDYTLLMAASIFTSLPIIVVFFAAQRHFLEGISWTGIKG